MSDIEASWERHPTSSVAWVLETSMLTSQKHSFFFLPWNSLLVSSNKTVLWIFWEKLTLAILTSDTQFACFCAPFCDIYSWTEFVIKVWPYNKLLHSERPKWTSSRKTTQIRWSNIPDKNATLHTLKWCDSHGEAILFVGIIEETELWVMSLDKRRGFSRHCYEDNISLCVYQVYLTFHL